MHYRGRGVFVCISPWNFPLAIFAGQIMRRARRRQCGGGEARGADAAGRRRGGAAVSPRRHPGDGAASRSWRRHASARSLVAHRDVAGVAFTGSTEVGRIINRTLAAKDGPIVPLIAETGGINAMIVDATALPEQVTDDVVTSAFRSAGQRCSALRLLCVQEDIADRVIDMMAGAAAQLRLGDPRDIDPCRPGDRCRSQGEARPLDRRHGGAGARRLPLGPHRPRAGAGTYVTPTIIALDRARDLKEEVFGPVLHVVRWRAEALDDLLDDIAASGYGLTLGIQSRIDATVREIVARLPCGNVYVNRNMIGAVVGTQPFGGSGLSGTGPKAGGPNYLHRFAMEQVVAINTAAAGGNASLLAERNHSLRRGPMVPEAHVTHSRNLLGLIDLRFLLPHDSFGRATLRRRA